MHYGRYFTAFFVSIVILILFVVLSLYSAFFKDISKEMNNLRLHRIRATLNSIYITMKYDLQNIARDENYAPSSAVYLYNKKEQSLSFYKGSRISEGDESEYIRKNIGKIVYLEDGFGYMLPEKKDENLFVFLALERGDNIYIAVNIFRKNDPDIKLCILPSDTRTEESVCSNALLTKVFEKDFFSIGYSYQGKLNNRLLVLYVILFIIAGAFLSFWVSRHFDLEEKRILSEIQNSVEAVEKGHIPLINIFGIYPSHKRLIEQINRLIQTLSSEINRHKVVYDKHFLQEEEKKASEESAAVVLNIFTNSFSEEGYKGLLKSFDLLMRKRGGSLRFKGLSDNPVIVRTMVFVILELLSHQKGYSLIVEADKDKIAIISDNADFESEPEKSALCSLRNIKFDKRVITVFL